MVNMNRVLCSNSAGLVYGLKLNKHLFFVTLFVLLSTTQCFPVNYGLDIARCDKICNESNNDDYRPQQCSKECPGYTRPSTAGQTDATRIAELEDQLQRLQAQANSLLVAVVLLFFIVMVAVPIVIYRGTLVAFLQPLCCSSDYKKRVAAKKKQIKRSRSSFRNNPSNAPVSRRTLSDGETNERNRLGSDRRRSHSVSGKFSSAASPSSTIIANQQAIGMSALLKEESATTMSPNPDTSQDSSTSTKSRIRHPSESSCAAECTSPLSSSYNNCSFGGERGYYNEALSTSSQGLSTSRTSCSTVPVTTLSAHDLLRHSKELDDSQQQHSSKLTCDSQPLSSSIPQPKDIGSSDESSSMFSSPDTNRSIRRDRRPSSPDSVMNSNILSNSTVVTTLSTIHSNV